MMWKCGSILALAALAACASVPDGEGEEGFRSLFNGKDISGWHPYRAAIWSAEDGILVGVHADGFKGGWLVSDEVFSDFDFRLKFRAKAEDNTGVAIRYPGEGGPSKVAYELQIGETEPGNPTGSLFNVAAAPDGLLRSGEWNTARVVARGTTITTYINGQRSAETEDTKRGKGHLGLQVHGGEKYKGTRLEFKDLRLRDLSGES